MTLAGCHAGLGWGGRSHEAASPDEEHSLADDEARESTPSRYHIVKPGETLPQLATLYGVTVADIVHDNGLDVADGLKPEQQIHIPGPAGQRTEGREQNDRGQRSESFQP